MNVPKTIENFLEETLGMERASMGKEAVGRAIKTVMHRNKITSISDYERLFSSSPEERQKVIDEIVVGETWFFRDKGPFDFLSLHAREIRKTLPPGEVLRLLSAACSTGEEAYSMVMTLLGAGIPPGLFSVDAVDISVKSLKAARRAAYGRSAFRETISESNAPYFLDTEHGRQVADHVVRQVNFRQDNLASPQCLAGCGPYHIIFCRNFLIYLTAEVRKRVFRQMDRLLLPGGVLFSGHSETLFWQQNGYIPIRHDRAFALFKPDAAAPSPVPAVHQQPPPASRIRHPRLVQSPPKGDEAGPEAWNSGIDLSPKAAEKETGERETSADPMLREARLLADQGDLEKAMRLCREFEKKAGPAAGTYSLMGLIHEAANDLSRAEGCFLKALYLDPGHYESLVHVSLLLEKRGDKRNAALYRERGQRNRGTVHE
ncbi:MAG: hypothetical protein JW943_12785 [Deltaproteobacteria bacterium]|nr:hypothetical protein [Deltaproteobacteria bacterium]